MLSIIGIVSQVILCFPVHYKMSSGSPGLYPRDDSSTLTPAPTPGVIIIYSDDAIGLLRGVEGGGQNCPQSRTLGQFHVPKGCVMEWGCAKGTWALCGPVSLEMLSEKELNRATCLQDFPGLPYAKGHIKSPKGSVSNQHTFNIHWALLLQTHSWPEKQEG